MKLSLAPELNSELSRIVDSLGFSYIKVENIVCFRSLESKSRAIARIWALPKIWQIALDEIPHYCIEVISERYDRLSPEDKEKVLIHELLHVPKNFSGALLAHNHNGRRINRQVVDKLHHILKKCKT